MMCASEFAENEAGRADEATLVGAARRGDHEAFRAIVEIYQGRLFTFLLRMVKQREEAEDLAQETFVRAWRNIHRFDPGRSFRTWLFAIARNLALNALRRPRARIVSVDDETQDQAARRVPAASGRSPADRAMAREQLQRLERAIGDLPPRAAMIVTLFYQEEMSIGEIARVTGMTAGAVKVALHRARESLRKRLVGPQQGDGSWPRADRRRGRSGESR